VVLKVNGSEIESRDITLDANKSQSLSFKVQRTNPGEYVIDLNGSSGKFTVSAPPPPLPTPASQNTLTPEVLTPQSTPVKTTPSVPAQENQTKKPLSPLWLIFGSLVVVAGIVTLILLYSYLKEKNKGQSK
jgi:hypothetical protein